MIRQNDSIGIIVVHDAVESAREDFDLLYDANCLEIEHRHGGIAAVCDKAVIRFRGECDAMRAGSIGNVADNFSGGSIHYHSVRSSRNEHSASPGLGSQVVGATITPDVVLLNLEGLCVANSRCNDGSDQQSRNRN